MSKLSKEDLIEAKKKRVKQLSHNWSAAQLSESASKGSEQQSQNSISVVFQKVFGFKLKDVKHDLLKTIIMSTIVLLVLAVIYWLN